MEFGPFQSAPVRESMIGAAPNCVLVSSAEIVTTSAACAEITEKIIAKRNVAISMCKVCPRIQVPPEWILCVSNTYTWGNYSTGESYSKQIGRFATAGMLCIGKTHRRIMEAYFFVGSEDWGGAACDVV